jgi:DNA-binding MurR/RpiR family transcriptional regulator
MTSGIAVLREILDSCAGAERKVAEFLIAEPRTAVFCTVAELARRAQSSPPAVVRLCKRAGLSGYRELQILLARDLYASSGADEEPTPAFELDSGLSVEAIAENAVERTKDALDRVLTILKPQSVEEAAREIAAARSVTAFGQGASGVVAYDLSQKLSRLGIICNFSFDPHIQITSACGLSDKDLAIAISYSGKTPSIVRAAEEAKRSGAKVLAIAGMRTNPLSKIADILLPIPATEPIFRQGASLSRSAQLLVIDILYNVLVSRNIERAIPLIERSMRATHGGAETEEA